MGDYIERQAVFDAYEKEQGRSGPWDFRTLINSVPATDVAPVVHGRWVRSNNEEICLTVKCSVCGMSQPLWAKRDYKFCPDCGAKMDKEDANNA